MILNGVMAVTLRYISLNLVNMHSNTYNCVYLWRNLCMSLLYYEVHVRDRRKESFTFAISSPDEIVVQS